MKKSLIQIDLPPGTVPLPIELVPSVRNLLSGGLSDQIMRSCVRFGLFVPFSGGRKSPLVGGLRIDLHAVLKCGKDELTRHAIVMEHVNKVRQRTFPTILTQTRSADGTVFLLMEELQRYVTLLNKIYLEDTTRKEFDTILRHVFDALYKIHNIQEGSSASLKSLARTRDPFTKRIHEKLELVTKADPVCACIFSRPGTVNGQRCPPLQHLLFKARQVLRKIPKSSPLRLVHGDPHFGNVMVRKNGKFGYRVRFIDPNPEIGFSLPIYDIGKLLHWAEPVGWAQIRPNVCLTHWRTSTKNSGWKLNWSLRNFAASAERRRKYVESQVFKYAKGYQIRYGSSFAGILAISVASAHLGLAALLTGKKERHARRFVLALALEQLMQLDRSSTTSTG